jgi:ankyrin repeat protein
VHRATEIEAVSSTNKNTDGRRRRWYIIDYPSPLKKPEGDHAQVLYLFQTGQQIVGFCPASHPNGGSQFSNAESQCANAATDWIRLNEKDRDRNEAAKILHFRSRLSYLTNEPITPPDQGWDTEIREMSRKLQVALQDSADYIFSSNMQLSGDWKNANALMWSTTCQLADLSTNSSTFAIHFLMYRNNGRWKISEQQLEAALGLWWWSLKLLPKERRVFTRKLMFAEGSKKMECESAIQLWVTQADMINERIQFLSPKSTNATGFLWDPTNPPEESCYPTGSSIPITTSLNFLNMEEDNSDTNRGNGVLAIQSRSSPLQMIAQDLFTIFISRMADIIEPLKDAVPRPSQFATMNPLSNPLERPYLGLLNTHIESITDKVVAAEVGVRQDVLMSIVPPLLQRSKLPQLDSVMKDLLEYAKSFRRKHRFQEGESLLKGLFHSSPPRFRERVVRALGELYRTAIKSSNKQEEDFGVRSFGRMKYTCDTSKLSDKAKKTVDYYTSVGEYFKKRSSTQGGQRPQTLDGDIENVLRDLNSEPARARGLTLAKEFDLGKASSADLLEILRWAIEHKSPELVEDLWTVKKELINEADDVGRTPIFWVIEFGCDTDTFQALLEWPNVRPDSHDLRGMTPFLLAAERGHCEAVELLLKQGVDSLAKDKTGNTALMLACKNGKYDMVKRLVYGNAEVNMQGGEHGSALATAAYRGWTEIVEFLIHEGKADANVQGGEYGSALTAAAHKGETKIVQILVQDGKANVNMQGGKYGSALATATFQRNIEIIKFLVQEGKADVNIQGGEYGSALATAAFRGWTEIVKFLFYEGKADVNIQGGEYGSALAVAAYRGQIEIVKFLVLEGKADVNMPLQGREYCSALEAAVSTRRGDFEILKFLVQEGKADVNMPLHRGDFGSALATATYRAKNSSIEFLVREGKADVNMPLHTGLYGSALAVATHAGRVKVVKFFVQEAKADVNMPLPSGRYGSALALAAYLGRRECVEIFLEAGAVVDLRLKNGQLSNALQAAGADVSEKMLFDHGRNDEARKRDKEEVRALLEFHQAKRQEGGN